MEQNNNAVPQEQPINAPAASGEQMITSYGTVSREYVESLIEKSGNLEKKQKKSVGKRILAWFFGIVGGATFLVLCVFLCFNAFRFTSQTPSSSGGSTYDEDFFYIPDFFGDYDDFSDEFDDFLSGSDALTDSTEPSNAGLGVAVVEVDSTSAEMYGISGGLVIIGIDPDSSFIGTDVKEYDIITGAEGVDITSTSSLSALLNKHQIGDEFTLTITRFVDGFAESFDVTVTLIDKTA